MRSEWIMEDGSWFFCIRYPQTINHLSIVYNQ